MSGEARLVYSIQNPCDPYTLVASSPVAACLACSLLGAGRFTLVPEGDAPKVSMPMFAISGGDADEWFRVTFGGGYLGVKELLEEHLGEVVASLRSVLIGTYDDRLIIEHALSFMSEVSGNLWLGERHERLRTSMSDIQAKAFELADSIECLRGEP